MGAAEDEVGEGEEEEEDVHERRLDAQLKSQGLSTAGVADGRFTKCEEESESRNQLGEEYTPISRCSS